MNPPPPNWLPIVSAIATLTAALVALFKEDIVKMWRRPILTMRIMLASPDCVRMPVVVRYKLTGQMGDGRSELVPEFIPMNLRWSDSPDPDKPLIFESINPAMGRYCDFATVSEPTNPTEPLREGMAQGESTFNLQTQVTPNTQGNRLKPGKYTIRLLVAASNAKPKAFTLSVGWKGRYIEETARMFGEAVKLTITG